MKSFQSGQVVLITLLVLSIATTIALSLLGRTTTDLNITNQVEESSRAFSAAEAGIEEALKLGTSVGATGISGASDVTYTVNRADLGGSTTPYRLPRKTRKGETESVWFVPHDPTTGIPNIVRTYTSPDIDLCWSQESAVPAVVVAVLYQESTDSSFRVARGAYDPSVRGNFSLHTDTTGCGSGTGTFYRRVIAFSSLSATLNAAVDTVIEMRIRPVYSDVQLAVRASSVNFPVQGNQFISTGSTTTGLTRKITVYQQYRSALGIFDYAVYSQNNFVQ